MSATGGFVANGYVTASYENSFILHDELRTSPL